MSRKDNQYLMLEASEQGPWIRYECGMCYAITKDMGNPTSYQSGEEFVHLRNAVKWLSGDEKLFSDKDVALFDILCNVLDKAEGVFLDQWKKDHEFDT